MIAGRTVRPPSSITFGRRLARQRGILACVAGLVCCLCACDSETWGGAPPSADRAMFDAEVYPLLMRDCGFNACHGGEHRFFQVFGPGRVRLGVDPMLDKMTPVQPLEIEVTYRRAVSMLVTKGTIDQAPLLTKPLEARAGGGGHKGVDDLGRNVYPSKQAAGYQLLLRWAQTATYGATVPAAPGGLPQTPMPSAGTTGG